MLQTQEIRQQIDSTNAAFIAALRRGDSVGMAAVYTEDGHDSSSPLGRGAWWYAMLYYYDTIVQVRITFGGLTPNVQLAPSVVSSKMGRTPVVRLT